MGEWCKMATSSSSSSTAVWTEKYRPTRLSDIKGHRRIKSLFERAIQKHFIGFPPTILYGPPGTGKTSIALALAQEAYPDISPTISTLYLNASDERSIEVIVTVFSNSPKLTGQA